MKTKYIKNILALICISFSLLSCSEDTMDKINEYEANPLDAQAQFIIPDVMTQTAFVTVGGDFSTYASVYIEHQGGVFNQLFNAEVRSGEPSNDATYNNSWRESYRSIKNLKTVITIVTTGLESGSKVMEGIAKVLLAYNGAVMTDLFGDIPFKEAGVTDNRGIPIYFQPVVDKQEDVYTEVFKLLDEAIALLATGEQGPIGLAKSNDYIYKGNTQLWIKAAKALKARYTMRLLDKSSNKTTDLNNILTYIGESFSSSSEEFKFDNYDGASIVNPLAAFTFSRSALGASQSYVDKLKERNDPRLTQMFISSYSQKSADRYQPIEDPSKLVLVPNGKTGIDGVIQSQTTYSCNITDIASKAPTLLLSYHEVLFLKAEAYARLGQKDNAEKALKEAITAGFANLANSVDGAVSAEELDSYPNNFDLSSAVSDKYYIANVKSLFDVNPLQEIMVQKYLAMNGANGESIEVYNDIRRLQGAGEYFVTLANPFNAQNMFPYRFIYGASDNSANPNVKALVGDGSYVYKEKIWWAGGTR